jgi:uncharacterized membrane protein (UPF0127 family)
MTTGCFFVALPLGVQAACSDSRIELRGTWGKVAFDVAIVADPASRAEGLMFRETMRRGAGMLFVYERPQAVAFWMKNTLIPLDMIFAGQDGVVRKVHSNATPGDLTPIHGGDNIMYVLEINGGLSKIYGISTGSEMRHEIFDKEVASWSC